MAAPPLVELANVGKTYQHGATALAGLDLLIGAGEFVSLLGPSGCGKSTALRMIAGLSQPTSGTIRRAWDASPAPAAGTDCRVPWSHPLGCVFQEPTLLPWTSVWNNVYLPLRLRGVSKSAARSQVDEALALVGLQGFEEAYPRELSGGMKMRASVARALVTRPQLLLLDEPFAALDEITRLRLNDDLLALWRERRWGALFITHSVFESVYLSTRVLVMSPRPGRVVEEMVIDLPNLRTAETRTSVRYNELCRRASQALERAIAEASTAGRSA
ncbi:MAG: ABC transporter ATP-binding protein [Planctomycetaceae bacterium]|nr:ABC transporter ATP-binding protein [Planctomycetaceae bacterium]